MSDAKRWFYLAGALVVAAFVFTLGFEVSENAAYDRCGKTPGSGYSEEYPAQTSSSWTIQQDGSGFTCLYEGGRQLYLGWFGGFAP